MNFIKKLFQNQKPIQTTLTITSSNGFHLRPIAKFANETKQFDATISLSAKGQSVTATQVPKILSLSLEKGESFELICKGKEAQKASEHLSEFFLQLMQEDKEVERITQTEEQYQSSSLQGESIARGVAIAPLVPYETQTEHANREISLTQAIALTAKELEEPQHNPEQQEIFLAQKALLSDALFDQEFADPSDFQESIQEAIEGLRGGKFASRIPDYRDIEQRVLRHMGIHSSMKLPKEPYILVAEDLLPSEVGVIAQSPVQGVILQTGSPTSHASILLRSEAIPSMIINETIAPSAQAILDANSGNLILDPTPSDLSKAQEQQQAEQAIQELSYQKRFEPTHTKQGKPIKVLANITDLASAQEAKELGADGVGLLRTEFLFMEQKPTLEEQTQAYREIFELFDEITIRTLDIGGDKSLPYIDIPKEENPFLGLRGIRFSLHEQKLFREQLLAIFQAVGSISSKKKIKIMFPMVSEKQEFRDAKAIALEVAQEHQIDISAIQFGIMIEVPSVILAIKLFDKGVDFYSIGTNDLTQYLFAIERTHPTLKVNPTHPILMSALKILIDTTRKPISICGELAGLEEATQPLIRMGYTTLSVSSKLIPSLKERIRHV